MTSLPQKNIPKVWPVRDKLQTYEDQTKTFQALGLSLGVTRHHLTFLLERFRLRDSCRSWRVRGRNSSSPTDLPVVSSPPEGEIKTPPPWSLSNMRACGLEERVSPGWCLADSADESVFWSSKARMMESGSQVVSSHRSLKNVVSRSHHKRHPTSNTPRKNNMEPENEPLEEEIPIWNHHFQVPC